MSGTLCLTYHIEWHPLNLLFGERASPKSLSSFLFSQTTLCSNCVNLNPPKANAKVGLKIKESFIGGGSGRRQEESSDCWHRREEGRMEDGVGEVSDCSVVPKIRPG